MHIPQLTDFLAAKMISFPPEQTGMLLDFIGRYLYWIPLFVLLACVYYLIGNIYGRVKRGLENDDFIVYCAIITLLVAIDTFLTLFGGDFPFGVMTNNILTLAGVMLFVFLPAIYCFHVWTQVSYKPLRPRRIIAYLAAPSFISAWMIVMFCMGVVPESPWVFATPNVSTITGVIHLFYWAFMLIRGALLCFNVLYQMPKHMRRSTLLMIWSLCALAMQGIIAFFLNPAIAGPASRIIYLVVTVFVLNRTFRGFFRSNSANVIATSREFVFKNLSTLVLILSKKGRILEWNKKGDNIGFFTAPKYLQPFEDYKANLLSQNNGVVSPHDENIITITVGDQEYHLMITMRPISEGDKRFGNLVEINEVTGVYSVLRYMESIAAIDQMTGLHNRNAYFNQLKNYMHKEFLPLAIVIGDVNNLKLINDSIGHLCGDRMLLTISDLVRACAPENAFISRIGGDEIVLLMPNASEGDAAQFVKKFNKESENVYDPEFGAPSISWGWAAMHSENDDYNEVFRRADSMMFARKKAFKQGVGFILRGAIPKVWQLDPEDSSESGGFSTDHLAASPAGTLTKAQNNLKQGDW